ncbi:MAG: PEP-CTERM sorting domain-containing protein [Nitrospirae bacterium]|nr:PEP-CTERM sorting domain-containing protein [Nitrospirota bacterium]
MRTSKTLSSTTLFMILFVLLLGIVNIAQAVPVVSYTNTYDAGPNLWTYEATIFNDTADLLYDFVIYPTANPRGAADLTLEGWGAADVVNTLPVYLVHWMADFGAEVQPGDTMSGFWFTYSGDNAGDIGSLSYSVLWGWDVVNDAPFTFDGATIPASSPVPEPGTFVLMAMGILGISVIGFLRNAVG